MILNPIMPVCKEMIFAMPENKMILFLIIAVFFICISILLIIIFTHTGTPPNVTERHYAFDTVPLLPEDPSYVHDYIYSAEPAVKWGQEKVDEWFLIPEGQNMDQLKAANDQMVRKILEAAP